MNFYPAPPQKIAINFLRTHPLAFLLIGMGIGKSAVCLYVLNELFNNMASKGALVIAPMRVCNLTWPMEVDQWNQFKHLKVANLRTQIGRRAFIAGAGDIYVINYESIPMLLQLIEKRGGELPFDTIIYDESTKAKNPKAKRIALLRESLPAVPRRWALTGTPMPNSMMDLYAQVRLLDDGERLGKSFDKFKKTFFTSTDYMERKWEPVAGAQEKIEQAISDITLTLRTSDWLKDVPDAHIDDIEIHMPPTLLEKYQDFERELVLELQNETQITAANAAALVSKLLQFTSGAIYDADKKWHEVHDLKIKALAKVLKSDTVPLLVACQFKHEQERIRKAFPKARFFADATTPTLQLAIINQWNRKEIPMLVAHPRSIGHGLNLQHGSYRMCWTSLTYSREEYEQFIARLVRRGQKDVVQVHRLMMPGTVDDVVAEVLENKRAGENRMLDALMMLEAARDLNLGRKINKPKEVMGVWD